MKKTASVLTAAILSLGLVAAASAQTRPATQAPATQAPATPERQTWTPDAGAIDSSKLIGMKVKSNQGKDVGEISQLIVDHASGNISHVIIGKGGLLGVGETKVALAWADVKIQPEADNRNRMVVMVDQSKVDGAPRYEARREAAPAASPATAPSTVPSSQPRSDKKN